MGSELEAVLDRNKLAVARELERAQKQLVALRAEVRALESQIARAEYAIGVRPVPNDESAHLGRPTTLRKAMEAVLRQAGAEGLPAADIAAQINRDQTYAKRDGSPLELSQIHAYVAAYSEIFERHDRRIRLKAT